jgi:site-specific recombinase XerD
VRTEDAATAEAEIHDNWIDRFAQHLTTDRGASIYTIRNYTQALHEFHRWHQRERLQPPAWRSLQRDDFRAYLRHLGRNKLSRAATQLRFSALRTFYKFLVRHGILESSPIKNISLPKLEKRLPRFLTAEQMLGLLKAPLLDRKWLARWRRSSAKFPATMAPAEQAQFAAMIEGHQQFLTRSPELKLEPRSNEV